MKITREEAIKILEMFLHKQCDLERTKFAYSQEEIWHAVKMATESLELDNNLSKDSKWIPCSERLPDTKTKPYQSVLLQVGNSIVVGYVNSAGQWFVDTGDGWCSELDDKPVAWQPLPEPYKEGET